MAQVKIDGRKWRLFAAPGLYDKYGVYGDCDHPSKHHKAIRYEPAQTDSQLLDTLLHETLHAMLPKYSEEAVAGMANSLSDVLEIVFDIQRKADPCESE
jgi:hypothetical protein